MTGYGGSTKRMYHDATIWFDPHLTGCIVSDERHDYRSMVAFEQSANHFSCRRSNQRSYIRLAYPSKIFVLYLARVRTHRHVHLELDSAQITLINTYFSTVGCEGNRKLSRSSIAPWLAGCLTHYKQNTSADRFFARVGQRAVRALSYFSPPQALPPPHVRESVYGTESLVNM